MILVLVVTMEAEGLEEKTSLDQLEPREPMGQPVILLGLLEKRENKVLNSKTVLVV